MESKSFAPFYQTIDIMNWNVKKSPYKLINLTENIKPFIIDINNNKLYFKKILELSIILYDDKGNKISIKDILLNKTIDNQYLLHIYINTSISKNKMKNYGVQRGEINLSLLYSPKTLLDKLDKIEELLG